MIIATIKNVKTGRTHHISFFTVREAYMWATGLIDGMRWRKDREPLTVRGRNSVNAEGGSLYDFRAGRYRIKWSSHNVTR